MLVPMHWLKQYVPVDLTAAGLAAKLTAAGLKVEGIHQVGAGVTGVVTGRILAVRPHPAAERLAICEVAGGDRRVTVVTGAPNVAPGQIVPMALPGARLSGADRPVTAAVFRGVASEGVLCAEDELGISADHTGIMILPADTPVGADLGDLLHLGDEVLEFEIYPNRPDCLSIVGIARETAAQVEAALQMPAAKMAESGEPAAQAATVQVLAPDLCPRYCARIIRSVRIGPSPLWMQQHLRAAGMRPINNVVDVTNYVMLELGQPLHAFDLSLVHEQRIVVRRAAPGEVIRTLDGQERRLDEDVLVIADAAQAVAVAGVMGGENSEITAQTRDILLESATFDPVSVRKTSRRLGLRTEASHRFEKGLDPYLAPLAADRAALLLAELCAGQVAPGIIDVAAPLPEPLRLLVRPRRVNDILGTDLSSQQITDFLRRLAFTVQPAAGEVAAPAEVLEVGVPSFRRDVTRETDLIEEVARMYTYDQVPATLPGAVAAPGGQSREAELADRVRTACVAAGLAECITYSFTTPRHFDMLQLPAADSRRQAIRLLNPLSEEQSVMRTTLLGNLLDVLSRNVARQSASVQVFELGAVFLPQEWPPQRQPDEELMLAIALLGAAPGAGWGERERPADFYDLKSLLERVAQTLRIELSVAPGRHPSLHPGRSGAVYAAGELVGFLGETHPRVQAAYDLPAPAYLLEINLGRLLPQAGENPQFKSLARFPALQRDLALLVPVTVAAAAVEETLRVAAGAILEQLRLFDVYQGPQVPAGYRSLAYSLTFRAAERTLTDGEVNEALARAAQKWDTMDVQLRR